MRFLAVLAVLPATLVSVGALAADPPVQTSAPAASLTVPRVISELRLGVFAHDPTSPESGSVDINGEILTPRLFTLNDPILGLLVPRLHLGGTVNTAGNTSHVYTGLTWVFDVTPKIFVEGAAGIAFHNGKTGDLVVPDRVPLGCSPLMRESGSIGYRLTDNWRVMATVEHISNAGTCSRNRGLTNYGVRLGYVF
ncbi:acyloxyacyl hydrolase [Bosea vaviloviae]|uniref:Lipid A 3-O-deacylase n=1 Tax=Bosea vaviloviae TaxID=1526658 RepID=A0A0N1N426_9HYPH|nr:acyloxyacyl hydrolase [Bosea vaviloviae]KPH81410.1 hypothetical protein AE618_08755 [Bosea vaviloviae]